GRGVVQLGSYLDLWLATFLAEGAVAALGYAQVLYLLPISLFAMSVAAAELPELSRLADADPEAGRRRVERSLRQIAFLVVPTTVGYLAFGYLLAGAVYRTGSFGAAANALVAVILVAYTLGLPASAASRLLQNAFFALGETRTPAAVAAQRVFLAAGVAVPLMYVLDRVSLEGLDLVPAGAGGPDLRLGALGLALGSAVGAWYEVVRLVRGLRRKGAPVPLPGRALARMAGLALAAALPATLVWRLLPALHPALVGLAVIGAFAGLYLGGAALARFPELEPWVGRLRRRR
ncbi:MAG TPA: lipid II flippase MurJ, partial [Thermoanaerobaculia bacterium]